MYIECDHLVKAIREVQIAAAVESDELQLALVKRLFELVQPVETEVVDHEGERFEAGEPERADLLNSGGESVASPGDTVAGDPYAHRSLQSGG